MHLFAHKNKSYPILFLLIVLFNSCNLVNSSGKIDEGTISYDIVYLQDEKTNPIISILPTTMTFKFKDGYSLQKIEGWWSVFQMTGITDRNDDKRIATLKIMNDKYYFETNLKGQGFGFDEMNNLKVVPTDSEKIIAGYKCKCSNVFIGDSVKPIFSVYYTNDINLDNPNCNNPFGMINGVLMQFQMTFQKIPMILTAKKVVKEDISDDEFKIPTGYVKVSREKMQTVISNLM
jgi:hypothetical protein